MSDAQPRSDDLPYRVLLAVPQVTNIPTFAMAVEVGRPIYDVQVVAAPKVEFNGNLLRSLPDRFALFGFLEIRHRRGGRTATYSSWLGFATRAAAEDFVGLVKHRNHGLDALIDRIDRELEGTRRTFETNLADGLFDLGRLEESRRRKQADLYVKLDDEIAALARQAAELREFRERPFGEHLGVSVG